MSYTKFGEVMRVLRIRHHETMADTAEKIGTSIPFLSMVECGKKNVPKAWIEKIADVYSLTAHEKRELEEAREESKREYKISAVGASEIKRRALYLFSSRFSALSDETAERIVRLLGKPVK